MPTPLSSVRPIRLMAIAMVLSLVAAACGGDDGAADETTTTVAPTTTTTSAAATSTTSTTAPATTTMAGPTTTTLPGVPFEMSPSSGDVLGVVAVTYDSVLNLRAGPGTDFEVLKKLAARQDRVIANGRAQALPNSIWYEVTALGVTGWSSATYLAYLGSTDDITSEIMAKLGGTPTAETMEELGKIVAESYPAVERPLRVKMSGAPSVGDLGEVIYDVVGFADDSVKGLRLHIFGQPTEGGEGFSLKSVDATSLCARGVDADLLCV